jgi:DNA repair exonuclease SbcCD nuclease subunit
MKNYDPIYDFKSVLRKIKDENNPDALLVAGDMFDFKKTTTAYLRHYEGEGLMIKVRNILREVNIPTYVIRGNHEKEEVLKGLEQTVENFHYIKNDWTKFSDTSIYFMDTHFEGELYEPDAVSQIIQQIISSVPKIKGKKILLSHETFAPYPSSLPKEVIVRAKRIFNWIINGHMHLWNPSAYDLKNVITLPSLLPSRVTLGKYCTERYLCETNDGKPRFERRDPPFGYVILDTSSEDIELQSFVPSKTIVEISVDVTGLSLKEVLNRFEEILGEINGRKDKNNLIVLPEMHGSASFVTTFITEVFKKYPELSVEEPRNNTIPKIITASGKIISPPLLNPERLFEEIDRELTKIRDELSEEVQMELTVETLRKILFEIRESELLEKIPPRTTTRLENLLSGIISRFQGIEKPDTFENDMKSIIRRVKE